ncbi:S-layer homology domain-containing protein [Paenibacillus eucommiae]|uniref:Fibronectin type-III domain-containing protein n=1 Tax=Paenibacillus eucommiae TaxID=1355755 RepID=A0ABS4J6J6_9BACL|nr:S-layer homology domain-containing protein [Paenibacillus eucommiae]MBP1995413.1 hypothetical protein [Paenibacillus eucommiae]
MPFFRTAKAIERLTRILVFVLLLSFLGSNLHPATYTTYGEALLADSVEANVAVTAGIPNSVQNLDWDLLAYNRVQLSWEAPIPGAEEDPPVVKYVIYDGNDQLLGETTDTRFVADNLEPSKLYRFKVVAVNELGVSSGYSSAYAGTSPRYMAEIVSLPDITGEEYPSLALSRDGKQAAAGADWTPLYGIDIAAKTAAPLPITADGAAPDGSIKEVMMNRDGSVIVFASNATNLRDSPQSGEVIGVYVFDRTDETLELLSAPGERGFSPSISGDGKKIVFAEGRHIILYDRTDGSRKLLSVGEAGAEENGTSTSPAISADGSTVAFISTSTNLSGGQAENMNENGLFLYNLDAGMITHVNTEIAFRRLALSEDGGSVAILGKWGGYNVPGVFRPGTGELIYLNEGRPQGDAGDKPYSFISISDDGTVVVADAADNNPNSGQSSRYNERYDLGAVVTARQLYNPTYSNRYGVVDGSGQRMLYFIPGGVVLECTSAEACEGAEPGDVLASAGWSAVQADRIGPDLKPGSTLNLQANGQPGLSVEAAVVYDTLTENGKTAALPLLEDGQTAGLYRANWTLPEGTARIVSIQAQVGGGSGKAMTGLPVGVASVLQVELNEASSSLDLTGAVIEASAPGKSTVTLPWQAGQSRYQLTVSAGDGYTVRMFVKDEEGTIVLDEKSGVTAAAGAMTSISLIPVPIAKLAVHVRSDGSSATGTKVQFKTQPDGSTIGEVEVDTSGMAILPGEHLAGEQIRIHILPPVGYVAEADRTISLKLGNNRQEFQVFNSNSAIRQVRVDYAKELDIGYSNRIPVQESDVTIVAEGTPGLDLFAKVDYRQWDAQGKAQQKELTLPLYPHDQDNSRFEGIFTIGENVLLLDRVTVTTDDGRSAKTLELNQNVAGRIVYIFPMPDPEIAGWTDQLEGAILSVGYNKDKYSRFWETRKLNKDIQSVIFDVPFANAPYSTTLSSQSHSLMSIQKGVAGPAFGQTVEIPLPLTFKYELSGSVTTSDGKPVTVDYQFTDMAGEILARGTNSYSIYFPLTVSGLPSGELQIIPRDPSYAPYTQAISMDTFKKKIDIVLQKRPLSTLSGTVIGIDGTPAASVYVTAEIVQDGFSAVYSARTNAAGVYTLTVPAGQVSIEAISQSYLTQGYRSVKKTVNVPETGMPPVNIQLLPEAKVAINLFLKEDGGNWRGPLPLNDFYRSFYGITSTSPIHQSGNPFRILALPGEKVRICADGGNVGMTTACAETVIGNDNTGTVELKLEGSSATVTGKLLLPDGKSAPSTFVQVTDAANGNWLLSTSINQKEGQGFTFTLPRGGKYRVDFSANGFTAVIEFDAANQEKVSLGNVTLSGLGRFGDSRSNGISLSSDTGTAGNVATVRFNYGNDGVGHTPVKNGELLMELPAGVEPIIGSGVVDGKPASFSRIGQMVSVPIGPISDYQRGSGHLQVRIGAAAQKYVTFTADISYLEESGAKHRDRLGTAILRIASVTLRAPQLTTTTHLELTGNAPEGAEVRVYDGNKLLGVAIAAAYGVWGMSVELADDSIRNHILRPEAFVDGQQLIGEVVSVLYNPNDPGLDEMTLYESQGKPVTFKTNDGIAIFPFVITSLNTFRYELKFRNPDLIYDVQVQIGDAYSEAVRKEELFVGIVPRSSNVGPVWVTYRKKHDPALPAIPAQTEEQLRETLPEAWRNYEILNVVKEGEVDSSGKVLPVGALEVKTKLSDDFENTVSLSIQEADYTLKAKDQAQIAKTGLPVYGFQVSRQETEQTLTTSVSFYTDNPALVQSLQKDIGGKSGAVGNAGEPGGTGSEPKKKFLKIDMKGMGKVTSSAESAFKWAKKVEGWVTSPQMQRAYKDLEIAQALCDPVAAEYYSNFATEIIADIIMTYVMKEGVDIVKGKAEGIPFAGTVIDKVAEMLDSTIEDELKELEKYLAKNECKLKPYPSPRAERPVANPKYIYDPSGYVYEGMPANRLEGVTTTVFEKVLGEWESWDSAWYGQINPQITDKQGRYGWDVPLGKWRVQYEKADYMTAYSDELDVPPPQTEVNIPMISYKPPAVKSVRTLPKGTSVEVKFTKPMAVDTAEGELIVKDADGKVVEGTVTGIDSYTGTDGQEVAMAIRFTPNAPLTVGTAYTLIVRKQMTSYASVPLEQETSHVLIIEEMDTTPPGDVEDLFGSIMGTKATLMWEERDDSDLAKVRIYRKAKSDEGYTLAEELIAGTLWAEVEGVTDAQEYTFQAVAVDAAGNESSGAVWTWSPIATEPDLTAPVSVKEAAVHTDGAGALKVIWQDPTAVDLAYVRVTWSESGSDQPGQSVQVAAGSQSSRIVGLQPNKVYRIELTAVDKAGNESVVTVLDGKTNSQTGSTPSGGSVGGTGQKPIDPLKWKVGVDGLQLDAFVGKLRLHAAKGALPEGAVVLLEEPAKIGSLPIGYRAFSPMYTISSESGNPSHPVSLAISYDKSLLGLVDPRRLGIYRLEEDGSWMYAGGAADLDSGRLQTSILAFGKYAVLLKEMTFADTQTHWGASFIHILASRGFVSGVSSDRFEPNRSITRAEAIKMLMSLLRHVGVTRSGASETIGNVQSFSDVPTNAWYASDVLLSAQIGLAVGDNGKFRPLDKISRQELVILLVRTFELCGLGSADVAALADATAFRDWNEVAPWAQDSLKKAIARGWITGTPEGRLLPDSFATRAESAAMIVRLMTSLGLIEVNPKEKNQG